MAAFEWAFERQKEERFFQAVVKTAAWKAALLV